MKSVRLITAAAIAMLMIVSACKGKKYGGEVEVPSPDLVTRVQECSRIYTGEYRVSKIVIQRDEKRIKGKFLGMNLNIGIAGGKRVIAMPVQGILKGYVDMSEITEDNIIRHGDSIEVRLPDPRIILTGTRITASDIREKVGLLQSDFSDEDLTELSRRGRDSLISEIPKLGLIENARSSSARALISLLSEMGYKPENIKITFSSDMNTITPARIKDMLITTLN